MTHVVGIRITNFGPFRGEHELDLGPGCYGVVARHVDDPGRSNGLGKTFFTGAIRWALEGKKIEGKDSLDELISEGEDSMEVEIELSCGAYLSRKKERGKATRFSVYPEAGERESKDDEAQELLDRVIIGVSAEDRETTCWSLQKNLDSLLRQPSGAVSSMMENWLGDELARLVDAGERVVALLGAAVKEHERAVAALAMLEGFQKPIAELESAMMQAQKTFAAEEEEYENALENAKLYERRKSVTQRADELKNVRAELVKVAAQTVDVPDAEKLEIEAREQLAEHAKAKEAVRSADVQRTKLAVLARGEFDGECPVSRGFECPAKADINARSEPHRKQYQEAAEQYQIAVSARSSIAGEYQEATARLSFARDKAAELSRLEGRKHALEERVVELEDYLKRSKADGLEPLEPDAEVPARARPPSHDALFAARSELEAARKVIAALPPARERVVQTAGVVRVHRLAAELLGPSGARRVLLKSSVDGIELEANERLAEVGVPLSVRAAWGRETKDLAEQCSACGSAFPKSARVKQCERCGSPRGLKLTNEFRWRASWTSGAGLDLAGLGLRVAGFRFLKEQRGVPWSVAVLDEPTAQMDEVMRRSVAAGIQKLLVGTFEQAFVTAHDQSTVESCDKKILITGHGANPVRSKIEVVG